jgi:hypothetical protein
MTIRVINGKRYDTEKSVLLANLSDSDNPNEARRWTDLYKTNKGAFFTLSRRVGQEGHNRYDETTVEPLSEEESKDALWEAEYRGLLTFDELVALQPHFSIDLQWGIEDA